MRGQYRITPVSETYVEVAISLTVQEMLDLQRALDYYHHDVLQRLRSMPGSDEKDRVTALRGTLARVADQIRREQFDRIPHSVRVMGAPVEGIVK